MFSCCLSVWGACVHPGCSFCDVWYALMNFHQTFISGASYDRRELVRFWGQKVKGRCHVVTKCAKNTIVRVRRIGSICQVLTV